MQTAVLKDGMKILIEIMPWKGDNLVFYIDVTLQVPSFIATVLTPNGGLCGSFLKTDMNHAGDNSKYKANPSIIDCAAKPAAAKCVALTGYGFKADVCRAFPAALPRVCPTDPKPPVKPPVVKPPTVKPPVVKPPTVTEDPCDQLRSIGCAKVNIQSYIDSCNKVCKSKDIAATVKLYRTMIVTACAACDTIVKPAGDSSYGVLGSSDVVKPDEWTGYGKITPVPPPASGYGNSGQLNSTTQNQYGAGDQTNTTMPPPVLSPGATLTCKNNGKLVNGACVCTTGFTGTDCGIDSTASGQTTISTNNGSRSKVVFGLVVFLASALILF
jgi:hypothetical protein